jgi:hypothetical protein
MKVEKSDIKLLVEEVIKERWEDFLAKHLPTILPSSRMSVPPYKLYTTVDDWVDDWVDTASGKYTGPEFDGNYDIYPDMEVIHNFTDPYPSNLVNIVSKWNLLVAEKYHKYYSERDVIEANKKLRENFLEDHEESILGEPPWPVYKSSTHKKISHRN